MFLKYFTLFMEQFTYCSFQNNSQQLGLQKTLHYYFSFFKTEFEQSQDP